ncbi:MAG: nucleotidyltransferase domain-containing protein [Pleurocapsa sp. SU_196_0]|nr:nucleotidyltransferase domain-containing protein [Pleurocapsa sp. SU_196_0]
MLDALRSGIAGVLGNNLVGVYVRGSLVTGEFDPATSDIDLLVVTRHEVTPEGSGCSRPCTLNSGRCPTRTRTRWNSLTFHRQTHAIFNLARFTPTSSEVDN